MHGGLIKFARMLRDQLADHFEMTEFLDGDVLKHVPDVLNACAGCGTSPLAGCWVRSYGLRRRS